MNRAASEMFETAQPDFRTTIEAFRAFIADRPDDEKWELIDGEIVLNPTANNRHQILIRNLLFELETIRRRSPASWEAIPGISTRHPDDQSNEPIPDVMIVPPSLEVFNWTFEVLAAFEVLSPFSVRRDMVRKRRFYSRIEALTHYVVLMQDKQAATVFARENGFEAQLLTEGSLDIASLGISIPLVDIYRNVTLG